jgi:hypothetical protein
MPDLIEIRKNDKDNPLPFGLMLLGVLLLLVGAGLALAA